MEPQTKTNTSPSRTISSAAAAALCTNGCGFFGSASNNGMCSKCFHESQPAGNNTCQQRKRGRASSGVFAVQPPVKKFKLSVVPAAIGSSSDAAAGADDTSSSAANAATQQKKEEDPVKKPATNRCVTCRRKVGLTGFQCRCGGTFCGSHRYADAHACGFDYKAAGREQIAKQNPVVMAAKIDKI